MTPVEQDIEIFQGDPHSMRLTFTSEGDPVDVSAWTFACQLRSRRDPNAPLLAEYSVDDSDAEAGVVVLFLTAAETAELRRDCHYDVQATVVGEPITIYFGKAALTREVTTAGA